MSVDIWCIGDLNYFVAVLNSLAMVAQSGLFEDLVRLGLILAVLAVMLQAVFMGNLSGGLPLGRFIVAWVLFKLLFGTTATVWVYDTYSLQSMQVDNVPYGVAFVGSVASKVAHEITETLEQAFSTPSMTNNGFAAPLVVLSQVRQLYQGLGKIQDGKVQKTLVEYVQKCTSVGIQLGTINGDSLQYQENPWQAMKFDSGIYYAMTWLPGDPPGGTLRTCTEAWNAIDNYLSGNFFYDWQGYLQIVFCQQNNLTCDPQQTVQNALDALVTQQQDARNYMLAAVLLPAFEQGQINFNSELGKPELSVIIGQAREQRNVQWKAEASIFATVVRPMMAFFEGFMYAITPFMALLVAFVPSGLGLIFKYFSMFIWVQLWMPILAILNHYLQMIVQQKLTALVTQGGIAFTSIQGQLIGVSNLSDWLATAGMLASSTPAISLALLFGGAVTMTHLAGRLQSGDYVNEKIAAPDVVQPGAVMSMASRYQHDGTMGGRITGAEAVVPRIEVSEAATQTLQSSAAQVATAQQSFREAVGRMAAHGALGSYGLSHRLQSTSGLEAHSGERFDSTAAFAQMQGHDLGLNQAETQQLTGILSANAAGSLSLSASGMAVGGTQGKGSLSGEAGLRGQLQSTFGADKAQRIMDSIQTNLNLSGNKSLQAAIDEKMSSLAASGQLREYTDTFRQDDITKAEEAAQQLQQAQRQYSETEQLARRVGMGQSVSLLAYGKMAADGGLGMSSREFLLQNRLWLPSGKVEELRAQYQQGPLGVTNEEQARWMAIGYTLHQQMRHPAGDHPGDKLRSETSGKLLMDSMNKLGLLTPETGDAAKYKGVVDPGKVEEATGHAAQTAAGLRGPGNVSQHIGGIRSRIPEVAGTDEVQRWYGGKAAGVRARQEEQRIGAARTHYDKLLDDTSREFNGNKSWSQTFLEGSMSTLQETGSGSLKAALTAVGGGVSGLAFLSSIASGKGFSGSVDEARQTWNQVRGGVWNYYFDNGKALGLDDNLSKMYAHGVLQGWSAAVEKQLGAAMPQLEHYAADRDQAVLARAEYLQGEGYGSAEARQRAEQEVSLAEKAGQTGMSNWAGKVVEGENLFHQAHEARFHMSAGHGTRGNLQQYEHFIMRAAQTNAVDPGLIRSVILAESKGNHRAVSPKGAMGLMQLLPGTARDMGVKNPYDPEQNIMGGTKYLRQMLSKFNGDVSRAVAAYHSGPEPVMKGEQPGPKTAKYVSEVMNHYLTQQNIDKARLM